MRHITTAHSIEDVDDTIVSVLKDLIDHGFGRVSIHVETIEQRKRAITIRAGRSHRYVLAPPVTSRTN